MLTGMDSLSYGELAGERMTRGLLLHDPEEEHDCFSDNTHNSHYYNVIGIQNVYLGRYKRIDVTIMQGPSPADFVKITDAVTDGRMRSSLAAAVEAFAAIVTRAELVEAYDQMIGEGNEVGNKFVQTGIDALLNQTKKTRRFITALRLKPMQFEGSDNLDDPSKLAQ